MKFSELLSQIENKEITLEIDQVQNNKFSSDCTTKNGTTWNYMEKKFCLSVIQVKDKHMGICRFDCCT